MKEGPGGRNRSKVTEEMSISNTNFKSLHEADVGKLPMDRFSRNVVMVICTSFGCEWTFTSKGIKLCERKCGITVPSCGRYPYTHEDLCRSVIYNGTY